MKALARRKILFWDVAGRALAVRHCSLLRTKFSDLRMEKEKLCGGESEGKRRCDLSIIPWDIFIAEDGMG